MGRLLAERLNRPLLDVEAMIGEAAGRPLHDVFRSEGEAGFRRLESLCLTRALETPRSVVLVGGVAACRSENLEALLQGGRVVALSVIPAEVLGQDVDPEYGLPADAHDIMREQEPFSKRAHLCVSTVGKTPLEVTREILAAL